METNLKSKTRVLKTKKGVLGQEVSPNSKIWVFEKDGKKYILETPSEEDIKARRNPAYQYLV